MKIIVVKGNQVLKELRIDFSDLSDAQLAFYLTNVDLLPEERAPLQAEVDRRKELKQ